MVRAFSVSLWNSVLRDPVTSKQMEKVFVLKVVGGLCNRMRSLISAMGYCRATDRELLVRWPISRPFSGLRRTKPEHRFEADLQDLWENPIQVISEREWVGLSESSRALILKDAPRSDYDAGTVLYETCHAFYESSPFPASDLAKALIPTMAVRQRMDRFEEAHKARPRIAIHLRTIAAAEESKSESPMSWFRDRIVALRQRHPQALYFAVADSPSSFRELDLRLGGGVLVQQCDSPGYNTRKAIQKALADLYLMGNSEYILGTYFSSFSYMAATLQGDLGYEDSKMKWGRIPGDVVES